MERSQQYWNSSTAKSYEVLVQFYQLIVYLRGEKEK